MRARKLRKEMSLPEVMLWQRLRSQTEGYKFRRQFACAGYVLDFACLEARLVIEVDGAARGMGDRPARDAVRDRRIAELGFRTLRIPAIDVLRNLDEVVLAIAATCRMGRPDVRSSATVPNDLNPPGEML